jgi:hypothetical protein
VTRLAHHDARTLFERAWSHGVRSGAIGPARREALVAEATRGICRIADVLGTQALRDDLERAMRSLLGLVNLNLRKVSGGDVEAAARSLAERGLLFHTKGASTAIKRVLAIGHGMDPDAPHEAFRRRFEEAVVSEWAGLSFEEFAARERDAERIRRRRAAADELADTLDGEPPDETFEPEQVIMTALLIRAYGGPQPAWIAGTRGYETLLEAVREAPARLRRRPVGLPPAHAAAIVDVWAEQHEAVLAAIVDTDAPVHQLVAGDPASNPLHGWLALPIDTLADLDELGERTTAHWQALTGGTTDEARLLWVMLQGVLDLSGKAPLGVKAAETLLRGPLATPPEDGVIEAWLDANAPHAYHLGLLELWHDFWDERESALAPGASADALRQFAREWLPVREAVRRAS